MARVTVEPDVDLLVDRLNGTAKDTLFHLIVSTRSRNEAQDLLFYLLTEGELEDLERRVKALLLLLFHDTMTVPKKTLYTKARINQQVFERMARCWRAGGRSKNLIYRVAAKGYPELPDLQAKTR